MTRCGWLAVATLAAGCSAGGSSTVPTVTTTTLPPPTIPAATPVTTTPAPTDTSTVLYDCIGRPVALSDSFARGPSLGAHPRQDLCD